MGAWTEKRRMMAQCDQFKDSNGIPIEPDPFEEDGMPEGVEPCRATNSMRTEDLRRLVEDFEVFDPVVTFHRWILSLDPPWRVESTGYATDIGSTYRYTCPECLYEKQYPY